MHQFSLSLLEQPTPLGKSARHIFREAAPDSQIVNEIERVLNKNQDYAPQDYAPMQSSAVIKAAPLDRVLTQSQSRTASATAVRASPPVVVRARTAAKTEDEGDEVESPFYVNEGEEGENYVELADDDERGATGRTARPHKRNGAVNSRSNAMYGTYFEHGDQIGHGYSRKL